MSEITLYDKALSNYNSACILMNNPTTDENQLNIIAYLIQQSLEFCIKYFLEQDGVEYPKTHNIEQLIRIGEEHGVDMHLTDYVEDHSEMFSQWESKSRYILGYLVEAKKIDRALTELEKMYTDIAQQSQK